MTTHKTTVALLFGGKSAEHEVSLQSAKNVLEAIDRSKYNPVLIGIDKKGRWYLFDEENFLINADDPEKIALSMSERSVALVPACKGELSFLRDTVASSPLRIDAVFPILHGPLGEDGTIQGLLRLAEVPFVGAGVLGSAVGMDKDFMKRLLKAAKLKIADYRVALAHQPHPSFEEVVSEIGHPLFVKPANMGSSVGVSKVASADAYARALSHAFEFDHKVIIEQFIAGREIECSVLGNERPRASLAGEVIPHHDFYSYKAKYIDADGAGLVMPAPLEAAQLERVQQAAVDTFTALGCEGLGRVDMFLTSSDEIYINEINTIPGFTAISMYPQLWGLSGIPYTELIDHLIQLALERFQNDLRLNTSI